MKGRKNGKTQPGIILPSLHREMWENLPAEQCKQLLVILFAYQLDGAMPTELPPDLRVAFSFLKPILDKQRAEYEETCENRRAAANKRWGNTD